MTFGTANDIAPTRRELPIIDAKAETIEETGRPLLNATTSAQPHFGALRASLDRSKHRFRLGLQGLMQPAPVSERSVSIKATMSESGHLLQADPCLNPNI